TGAGTGRRRLLSSLVVAEMVLSMALLVGAGLIIKGFFSLTTVFRGFQPANVLVLTVSLPENRYKGETEIRTFFDRAISGIAVLPGVECVSTARNVPASNVDNKETPFTIAGRPTLSPKEPLVADSQIVCEAFFNTRHGPVLEGHPFTRFDGSLAPPVVVINQTMAERFWQGESAVGSRIKLAAPDSDSPWLTVVGVCGDLRQNWWDAG